MAITAPIPISNTRSNNNGFTLVELLVVIAVIAILAAVVLPALARGKALGKRAYCQNNLHQLGVAFNLYADDYGKYPPCFHYGTRQLAGSNVSLWNAFVLPFVANNLSMFNCPSFPDSFRWTTNPSAAGYAYPTNIEGNRPFCYALNACGTAPADFGVAKSITPEDEVGRKPSEFAAPADMIAIGDDTDHTTNNTAGGYKLGVWGRYIFTYLHMPEREWTIGTTHNAGANMVFLDDHVEWEHWWKWIEFSDAAAQRWNYDNQPHHEFW